MNSLQLPLLQDSYLCRCLKVTEAAALHAIETFDVRTLKQLGRITGAGTGCTCCHARIRDFMADHAGSDIFAAALAG